MGAYLSAASCLRAACHRRRLKNLLVPHIDSGGGNARMTSAEMEGGCPKYIDDSTDNKGVYRSQDFADVICRSPPSVVAGHDEAFNTCVQGESWSNERPNITVDPKALPTKHSLEVFFGQGHLLIFSLQLNDNSAVLSFFPGRRMRRRGPWRRRRRWRRTRRWSPR